MGCEGDCATYLTMTLPSECSGEGTLYEACKANQPTEDFICTAEPMPAYFGDGCASRKAEVDACLDVYLPAPTQTCVRFCDLDATVCGKANVDFCQDACRNMALIPECIDEYEARIGCIAAFDESGLFCNAGAVDAADRSCDDESAALNRCFDEN